MIYSTQFIGKNMESTSPSNELGFLEYSESNKVRRFRTPFGAELGSYEGVVGYSNGGDHHYSGEGNFVGRIYTGVKWQCVEYARRWLILRRNLTFSEVNCAYDIWNLKSFKNLQNLSKCSIVKRANGSEQPPTQNSVLIWKRSRGNPYGHVAIISEVNVDKRYIRVAEQNLDTTYWPGNYSREIPLIYNHGWYINDTDPLYGWIEISKYYYYTGKC